MYFPMRPIRLPFRLPSWEYGTIPALAILGAAAALGISPPSNAGAATASCANVPRALFGPVGCGAVFLPGLGGGADHAALTLTASAGAFDAPLVVEPYDGKADQDFTLYEDGKGFVLEYTPDGLQPPGGLNSSSSLCAVDNAGRVTLGFCDADYAWYTPGYADGPNGDGVPGAAHGTVRAEVWTLRPEHGGAELVNAYSGRVMDDSGSGGPGTRVLTWRGHDGINQVWRLSGCTNPVDQLGAAWYGCVGS